MARFYITFRCNSRCGYCNVWQDPVFFGHDELDPDGLRRSLDELAALGVTTVDFTGGEPALHKHLEVAARHAGQLGMHVELTTNAIRFAQQSREILPYVDTLNISLDTLSAQKYHAIRGVDTLHRTIDLVESLRDEAAGKLKIISVVSQQTLGELGEIVDFASTHRVPVYLSPMFAYFEEQAEVRDPARTARSLRLTPVSEASRRAAPVAVPQQSRPRPGVHQLTDAVREQAFGDWTIVDLSFLRRLDTIDPAAETDCAAGSRIVTIGPDGRVMLPCYHEWDESLPWDRPYADIVAGDRYREVAEHEVGRRDACRGCTVFPYQGLATSYHVTAGFLTQAVSQELGKVKVAVRGVGAAPEQHSRLLARLAAVLAAVDRLPLRAGGTDELYHYAADPAGGVRTDLAAAPLPVAELLADHAREDAWSVQRTPHRLARLTYADILPALARLAAGGSAAAADLTASAAQTHLAVWAAWLQLARPELDTDPAGSARTTVSAWCALAGPLLADAGEPAAAASVAALAALFGEPAGRLAALRTVRGHREEGYLLATAAATADPADRAELAAWVELAELADRAGAAGLPAAARPADGTRADLAAAADGDPAALEALVREAELLCRQGDDAGLHALVADWHRAAIDRPHPATAAAEYLTLAGFRAQLG